MARDDKFMTNLPVNLLTNFANALFIRIIISNFDGATAWCCSSVLFVGQFDC